MAESLLPTIEFSEPIHGSGHWEITIRRNPGKELTSPGGVDTTTGYFYPTYLRVYLTELIKAGSSIDAEAQRVLDKATKPLTDVREFRRRTNTALQKD